MAALLIAGGSTSSTFRWDARQLWNCAQGAEPARRSFAGFSEAIILHPSVAETWNYRDTTLQHRDALAAYDRAIALKPYLTEPWLVLSLVLSLLGNHEGRSLRPPSCQIIIERLDDAGDVS